jgi:hypothetical protein
LNTRAFLNENLTNSALRHPDNIERNLCRNHFKEYFTSIAEGKKIGKGADTIYPHEIIRSISTILYSNDEHNALVGTWNAIVTKAKEGGGLGRSIPMCDFSGSMSGLPKLISLALGILVSEINHASFKDHILTFDSDPKWHSFSGKKTLKDKLDSINDDLGQGTSTNFFKACMCILDKMKEHRVPVGEEPEDLIVLTDMGFDDTQVPKLYEVNLPRKGTDLESTIYKRLQGGRQLNDLMYSLIMFLLNLLYLYIILSTINKLNI